MVMRHLRTAVLLLLALTVITGILYPLFITALAQVLFPAQANGSLIVVDGKIVGSALIGQFNDDSRYFWSRPSAVNYNPLPSGGSNLGLTSQLLRQLVEQRAVAFRDGNGLSANAVLPSDMLFASASGLDPHISPQTARLQIARVAEARNMSGEAVTRLVEQAIEPPQWGVLGEPRVNVLLLNRALDALQ